MASTPGSRLPLLPKCTATITLVRVLRAPLATVNYRVILLANMPNYLENPTVFLLQSLVTVTALVTSISTQR